MRRTWAPKGETPVLIHAFNWKRMSIAAALAFNWNRKRSRLFFQTKPDSYNTGSLIDFLKALKREFRGRGCSVIWDGLPAHVNDLVKARLSGRGILGIRRFQGSAVCAGTFVT